MNERSARPPGWYGSPLWGHIETMWSNIQASHVHLAPARERLEAIENKFDEITTGWHNPEDRIGAMLLIRTISADRV